MRILMVVFLILAGLRPAFAGNISTFELDNGLEAVVIEDHRAPVVVQMLWYKVGSADELRGKSGIAHYLEHLMFKGTDKLAPGELSKIVAANGGSDNAFTSYDYTVYFQRIAADRLPLVMGMEADRMRNLRISPDDAMTELQVILEERSERIDSNQDARFEEQMRAAQFLNSPYGTPVIGWRKEMEGLTRTDALAWYHRYYAPDNAILVVAGDVNPDEVKALAEKYYGPLKPTGNLPPRARAQEPPQYAARKVVLSDDRIAQPYLVRSYLAPERNPGDQKRAAALTILAAILGGNQATSVLGRKLVYGDGTAIQASADYDGMSIDPTTFSISVVPAGDVSLAEAEKALDAVLQQFLEDGIDPEQFRRIMPRLKAAEIYSRDDTSGLAHLYGEALVSGFSVQDVQDWPDTLMAVSEDDVMVAAKDLLQATNAVTGFARQPDTAPAAADGAPVLPASTQKVTQ